MPGQRSGAGSTVSTRIGVNGKPFTGSGMVQAEPTQTTGTSARSSRKSPGFDAGRSVGHVPLFIAANYVELTPATVIVPRTFDVSALRVFMRILPQVGISIFFD